MATDTFTMSDASGGSSYGTIAWACDEVESYLGGSPAAGEVLKHVKAGYDEFLNGVDPRDMRRHEWTFLESYAEITLTASVSGTADGTYSASASGRQLGTIEVTPDSDIFTSSHVGMYLTVEDVGTYRITSVTDGEPIEKATVQVLTGQKAAGFSDKTVWLAGIYDLPSDFNGLLGNFYYMHNDSKYEAAVRLVPPDAIYRLWQQSDSDDEPRFAAVVAKEFADGTGQRWQLLVAPRPTDTRVWRYSYKVHHGDLSDTGNYFLGGPNHYETIKALSLADAEEMTGKTSGVMRNKANRLLAASIDEDEDFSTNETESLADEDTGISFWVW